LEPQVVPHIVFTLLGAQEVPTEDWGETEVEMLLSQAYVLSTLFGGSDAHLANSKRAS
jgi:hypothetical protein